MSLLNWILWPFVLIAQNFAFTFVSRARNSGSLKRHLIAGIFSNGIWFISQIIIFTTMFAMMTGKYGLKMAVFTGLYYTVFTLTGSILAHYFSLKTEKGKSAVGATKKYAQIPVEDWNRIVNAVRTDVILYSQFMSVLIAKLPEALTTLSKSGQAGNSYLIRRVALKEPPAKSLPQYVAISPDPGVSLEKAAWKP